MSALPDPLLLAAITAGLIAAFVLGEARHAALARWRRRKTPVPGNAAPPIVAAPHTPLRQPPAPGCIHPVHGTKLLSADFYEDGVVLVHDHLRCRTTKFEPPAADLGQDPDEWLKDITP